MTRIPLELVLPRTTIEAVTRRARARPRASDVRIRVCGDSLVARRWVHGPYATGHSVLRAHLEDAPDGVRLRGTVAPSGLDLALIAIWFAGALTLGALGAAFASPLALALALVPLAFGVVFAAWLPRAVRAGHEVLRRTLVDL